MWNRNKTFAAIGLVLAGSFFAGVLHLVALRAESGAFYPPYSTFRADPLGTRAFYESLKALPGLHVDRNVAPLRTLGSHREITCLFLGDSPTDELPESVFERVEEIPSRGGRLVIAFAPQAQEDYWRQLEREAEQERDRKKKESKKKDAEAEETDADETPPADSGAEPEPAPADEKKPETVEECPGTVARPEEDAPAASPGQCTEAAGKGPSQERCNQTSAVGIHPRNAFRRSTPASGGHEAAHHESYGSVVNGENNVLCGGPCRCEGRLTQGQALHSLTKILEAASYGLSGSVADHENGSRPGDEPKLGPRESRGDPGTGSNLNSRGRSPWIPRAHITSSTLKGLNTGEPSIFAAAHHELSGSPIDHENEADRRGRRSQTGGDTPERPIILEAEDASEESEEPESEEDEDKPRREYARWISLEDRWGAGIAYTALAPDGEGGYIPLTAERTIEHATLPDSLSWHSAIYLENLSDAWRVVYAADERPVVVERDFGTGTIVFVSDSFPFSNEALRKARHPGFLAWVVGDKHRVIFDETHLGIQEGSGVMVLARQYRMHGLFIGLAILALLYVWKSASPLAPRYAARGEGDLVVQTQGRDAVSGLANLLKRSIPKSEVLNVCLTEWGQAFGRSPRNATKLKNAEAIAARAPTGPLAGADIVEAYRNISAVLSKRGE
ncbi:MAG: DUF4350 domain-containing protein [Candidatus Hydrogenedentota bacterium]